MSIDEEDDMEPATESREIERDAYLERMRARLRELPRVDEKAAMRFFSEIVARFEQEHETEEERELWLRNEKLKALNRKELMEGCLTFDEAAQLLELSEHALHMRIRRNKLLSFQDGKKHYFPRWQFDLGQKDKMVHGFDRVLEALESASSPDMKIRWLSRPWAGFGGEKPIDVLRSGRIDEVVEFAQSLGGGHR